MEWLVLLVIAIICLGPKQMRDLSYQLGRLFRYTQLLRSKLQHHWQMLLNEQNYRDNLAKAKAAEQTDHDK